MLVTGAVLLVSVALVGSVVDGLESRVVSLDSYSSWSDLIFIASSLSSSLISLAGIYFKDSFFYAE